MDQSSRVKSADIYALDESGASPATHCASASGPPSPVTEQRGNTLSKDILILLW